MTVQTIQLTTSATTLDLGQQFLVTVGYDVDTGESALTGIGVRLHYDSTELQFDNSSILFANSLFGDILDGGESFDDGDSETDREITFQYVDFVGNFPNTTLPVDLLTLAFTTLGGFNGSSLNVTFSSTASGYEGQGDSLELTSFGTDTGSSTGSDTGAGTDTGSDTGSGTGIDTGAGTGTDTGTDTGSDTGAGTGTDTGTDTGSGSTLTISPLEADKPEGNSGSTPFTFEVTRTGNTDNFLTVDYQVVGSISDSADAEDFIGNQVETVTTSRQVTIPSTGQELGVSLTLPDTSEDTSITATGLVNDGDVNQLATINIAYVIDVSGSTASIPFAGNVSIGDLNGDGDADEVIDAEIAAFESLNQSIIDLNLGAAVNVALIPFAATSSIMTITSPNSDSNSDGQNDISTLLRGINQAGIDSGDIALGNGTVLVGGTDFEAALQQTISFFDAVPDGDNFVFFLSDGEDNRGGAPAFADEVSTLLNSAGINAAIRPLGVGSGSSLEQLDFVDDGIDNNSAQAVLNPDDLAPELTSSPIEPAAIDRVELYRNGTLIRTIAGTDLTNTPLGLQYTVALDGLDLLANDTIEARVIATDSAATTVATSQVVEASESVSTLPAGTLTFTAGETTKVLTINVAGDTNIEPNENFNVVVTDPSGLTDTASGVIENDDLSPVSSSSVLFGTPQADTLDATTGQYTVIPLASDDTILVNTASDVIIELPNEGTDTIVSSVNYNLAALTHIENLTLTGTDDITGIGNRRDNVITGNSGQNVLVGLQGDDTFVFNFGDSTVAKPDRIRDFGVGQDRIQIGSDPLLSPSELPSTTNNTATTLTDLVTSVFADANGVLSGNQPLAIDSAALVTSTVSGIAGTYLVVNDETAGFNAETDLIINIGSSSVNTPIFIL